MEAMMRRIYFLVPNRDTTKHVVDKLLLARVQDKHIHVLAKRGTPLEDLPEANLLQKSDFIPAIEQGLALGGATGMLAGLVAIALPPASTVVAGGVLLACTLGSAAVGAWLSGMVGMSIGNRRTKEFEDAIDAGHFLVLVDVPFDRVEEIKDIIKQQIPELEVEETEPQVPAFP